MSVQTSRTLSPGVGRYVTCPLAGGVAVASGLNASWVSTMDKYRITMGLELSLSLIASQGIMHLMDHRLCQWEKQLIKREIGAEMVCMCLRYCMLSKLSICLCHGTGMQDKISVR